ncbi:LANO_0H06612g1_1 [Lachancea nothofagi CBS 11611]|uniref:LANO_0H06612g1_1 n=1 Tax=Lachancea nothofagi CBS 11611 TaxID=1266666 RepID=A0A1G4KLH9_9SACH|nr:LANO_0H06612g1_1 [Lachancea nothofagi CBS 11611]
MSYSKLGSVDFGADNWCLKLQPLYNCGLLVALSNGTIQTIDWTKNVSIGQVQAHETCINDLKVVNSDWDNGCLIATAAEDSVKIFDIRSNDSVATIKNQKSAPFLSLDSRHGLLACGTELSGVDAELHLYDIRSWQQPVRSLVDSHHDDITTIKLHPSDPNVLLSGSTDGYVNIYDLTQTEEEDALHQVINFASIHSSGWLSPNRIYALSHMETFGLFELNNKLEDSTEPKPMDFGDIRAPWDCNYVVDVYPGFIATGKTEEGKGELKLIPFHNEEIYLEKAVTIPHAHGDEVIRDVLASALSQEVLYSCGEDGCVNAWKSNLGSMNLPREFWQYSQTMDLFGGDAPHVEMSDVFVPPEEFTEPSVTNSEPLKTRKKSSKVSKSSKGSSKSTSKDRRFQPY